MSLRKPRSWAVDAACVNSGLPLDSWFPTSRNLTVWNRLALECCDRCTVADKCASERLPTDQGIWGGQVWWAGKHAQDPARAATHQQIYPPRRSAS